MVGPEPVRDLTPLRLAPGAAAVADLHLDPASAAHCAPFVRLLDRLHGAPALLVLGDLYDAWVGNAHAALEGAAATVGALARLTASGTAVHLLHGNRDFLLDERFERLTGTRVWPRGILSELPDGSRCLWIHGDELCTRDVAYQRLRRVVRSGPARRLARAVPLSVGRAVARRLRRASVRAVASKPSEEKSIQLDAAAHWAREVGVPRIVCGHAHEHRVVPLEGGAELVVVDAFGGPKDALRVAADGRLEALASADLGVA